jgi:hypothetical protein
VPERRGGGSQGRAAGPGARPRHDRGLRPTRAMGTNVREADDLQNRRQWVVGGRTRAGSVAPGLPRLGQTDPLAAEAAARGPGRCRHGRPEGGRRPRGTDRGLTGARETADPARSPALIPLKTLGVTAPAELRRADSPLLPRRAGVRPGPVTTPLAATTRALRTLARRWLDQHREVHLHDGERDRLTQEQAPELRAAFGIGTDTAAAWLIVAEDNPRRIRSEVAASCGVGPLSASSGPTTRHRLNRGGHRKANAALYWVVMVRMRWLQPTIAYTTHRLAEGKTKAECLKRDVAREVFRHLACCLPGDGARQRLDLYRTICEDGRTAPRGPSGRDQTSSASATELLAALVRRAARQTGESQPRPAVGTEVVSPAVFVLAPGTLHAGPPRRGVRQA